MRFKTYKISIKERIERHFENFKKYCIINLISGFKMLLLLFILTSIFNVFYLLSFLLSSLFSITLDFVLNKKYTFNKFNPKTIYKQYSDFFIVSFSSFIINFILLFIFVEYLHLWYLLSQLLISFILAPLRFLIHQKRTFSHKKLLKL